MQKQVSVTKKEFLKPKNLRLEINNGYVVNCLSWKKRQFSQVLCIP